jgi:uncharacterized protein (TIGR03435 family)
MSKRGSSSFNRSADMRIAIGRLRKMSVMVAIALAALAQPQSRSEVLPAFEVATIKPTDPAFTLRSIQIPPNDNTLTIRGLSLKELIQFCWGKATVGTGLHPALISGGPSWAAHDRYDVVAKAEGLGIASREGRKQMLKALLIERFQLTFHHDTKVTVVYTLTVTKNGSKMRARKADDGGSPFSLPLIGLYVPGRNVSIDQLADFLQSIIPLTEPDREDLPVVNQTGLAGGFDFDLRWSGDPTLEGGRGGHATDPSSAPDLFGAIQEQLGLKLEVKKTAVEILVLDHVGRPPEN